MSQGLDAVERTLDRLSRRSETPVALCIDVEPDPRAFDLDDPPPWEGFQLFVESIRPLRKRLSEATGRPAAFTWFLRMDPQIEQTWNSPTWVVERHGDLLDELTQAGDELGLHTHVWRWDAKASDWVVDFEDAAWAEHCVTMGLDAYEEALGRACRAHRGGDRFLSPAILSVLQERGVEVDLTIEPGLPPSQAGEDETVLGFTADYRGLPSHPYRSSPDRFPAPDPYTRSGTVLLPHASARRRRPPFERVPLLLWEPGGAFGQRLAMELLKRPSAVAFAIRSDTPLNPEGWQMISERIEHLADFRGMVFKTATECSAE